STGSKIRAIPFCECFALFRHQQYRFVAGKFSRKNWVDFQIETPTLDIPAVRLATKALSN
ncbi:MAG: hypothetical protein KAV87_31545, partial [Desulfobacteraceae bacterium]|nr:hypothetical protein [Desulfobacteraceae bacterium]